MHTDVSAFQQAVYMMLVDDVLCLFGVSPRHYYFSIRKILELLQRTPTKKEMASSVNFKSPVVSDGRKQVECSLLSRHNEPL